MVIISSNVHVLEMLEPDFFGTVLNHNITFIENGYKNGLVMIDTGLPGNIEIISNFLKKIKYSINDVSYIFITHYHPDHTGNVNAIKEISKAKVIANENEKEKLLNESLFNINYDDVKSTINVNKEDFYKTTARIDNIRRGRINADIYLKTEETFDNIKVINSPGHTKGHISILYNNILIAGDAINNTDGIRPPFMFFCDDYAGAINSFNKLINIKSKMIIPFHGEIIKN